MPGTTPPTSQLDWLNSTTAMIVLFWSRATRDLLRSFGWGIAALHRLFAATKLPRPRRPPHSVFRYRGTKAVNFRSIPGAGLIAVAEPPRPFDLADPQAEPRDVALQFG